MKLLFEDENETGGLMSFENELNGIAFALKHALNDGENAKCLY